MRGRPLVRQAVTTETDQSSAALLRGVCQMQEFSLVNQVNKAVRKLDMVLTLEFHRPAGLWQQ